MDYIKHALRACVAQLSAAEKQARPKGLPKSFFHWLHSQPGFANPGAMRAPGVQGSVEIGNRQTIPMCCGENRSCSPETRLSGPVSDLPVNESDRL
jgi:hypothetical protein